MADKQWVTSPTLGAYLTIAKTQISAIWNAEVYQSKLPNVGDSWGDWNTLNISYFAPAYYRVFATVDPNDDWAACIKTTYDTITNNLDATNGNQSSGLVPGFSSSQYGALYAVPAPTCTVRSTASGVFGASTLSTSTRSAGPS